MKLVHLYKIIQGYEIKRTFRITRCNNRIYESAYYKLLLLAGLTSFLLSADILSHNHHGNGLCYPWKNYIRSRTLQLKNL